MTSEQSAPMQMQPMAGQMQQGGHLYIQTNEVHNAIVHYFRGPDGKLNELERIPTGGAGSGPYKPGQRPGKRAQRVRGREQRHPDAG
jgi:hypothetical protein